MKNGYKGLGVTKKAQTEEDLLRIIEAENLKELLGKNQILSFTIENIVGTHKYKIIVYKYVMDGVLYTDPIEYTVTLANGAADFDRWDVFVLNADLTITANVGTVTVDVLKATVLEDQIEITSIIVRQNSIESVDIQTIPIYRENLGIAGGEFDTSRRNDFNAAYADFDYTKDKSEGLKSIHGNNIPAVHYLEFVNNIDYQLKDITAFLVDIKLIKSSDADIFKMGFLLEDKLLRSTKHTHFWIDHINTFGLDYSLLNQWQTINIPVNSLNAYGTEVFNQLVVGHNHYRKTFLLDNIRFQTGGVIVETVSDEHVTKTSELINDGENGQNPFLMSVGLANLDGELSAIVNLGASNTLIWSGTDGAIQFIKTMTIATTLQHSNLVAGKHLAVLVTGSFVLGMDNVDLSEIDYDGTMWNLLHLYCADATNGSEKIIAQLIGKFTV